MKEPFTVHVRKCTSYVWQCLALHDDRDMCVYVCVCMHVCVCVCVHSNVCLCSALPYQATLVHWTKKVIVEEGHSINQLVHIL